MRERWGNEPPQLSCLTYLIQCSLVPVTSWRRYSNGSLIGMRTFSCTPSLWRNRFPRTVEWPFIASLRRRRSPLRWRNLSRTECVLHLATSPDCVGLNGIWSSLDYPRQGSQPSPRPDRRMETRIRTQPRARDHGRVLQQSKDQKSVLSPSVIGPRSRARLTPV